MPRENPAPASASVSVDRIVAQFEDWAWTEEPHDGFNTYWWWARDVRVDPDEIIASGDGSTFRVPFTTDGEHDVTFGTPVEVRETYVDVAAPTAAASAAQSRHSQRVLASALPVPDRITKARASAEPDDSQENEMDENVRTVLERQGLDPETATEDQINAASVFAAASALPEGGDPQPEPEAVTDPEPKADDEDDDSQPAAEQTPADVAALAAKVELLERQNAALVADKQQRDAAASKAVLDERVARVAAACKAGVITPAEVDTWTERVKDQEKGEAFASVLAEMTPKFGTAELGGDTAVATALSEGQPLPENVSLLTPAERAQRAA